MLWKDDEMGQMDELVNDLRLLVAGAYARLGEMRESEAEQPISPGKWSRKEIVGHLIDSAANNHQRFVRGQLATTVSLPGYEQAAWVDSQRYGLASWEDLLDLWRSYNRHLQHVIQAIPAACLGHRCVIDEADPVTLQFLAEDYVEHLRHHVRQMLD